MDNEAEPFITKSKTVKDLEPGYRFPNLQIAWLSAIFFACSTLYLVTRPRECQCSGTFADGWATDFGPAKSQIELEQIHFTGGPAWKDNLTQYVYSKSKDNEVMYVPHPDPVDYYSRDKAAARAWEELIEGRYFLVTDEEAFEAWGAGYERFWDNKRGGYVAGLDLFHTLHCVHMITMMTPEGLEYANTNHDRKIHYHHCLTQVRQYVMCAGDLTPIPSIYFNALAENYVQSDFPPHTCRNFQKIRDWSWERYNGSMAVPARERVI